MTERAVPFYCPYCGEEDLRPAEQTERVPHGAWYCPACLRTFALKMIGIGVARVSELASEPVNTASWRTPATSASEEPE
jgi:ribosomal protein L37AE/L43A